MKLSNPEKLILTLLSDISLHLNIEETESGISPSFIMDAISSGNEWAISYKYNLYSDSNNNPDYIKELCNILSMWSTLESAYDLLSEEDKEKVKSSNFDKAPIFEGFDGQNEDNYLSATNFIIKSMDGDFEFLEKDRETNSHSTNLPKYRAMNTTFNSVLKNDTTPRALTADQIIDIITSGQI